MTKTMLEAFVSKSILYVYQNARWNQRKIDPQNIPQKMCIFLPKMPPPPPSVFSPFRPLQ
jgi:hypothetical protein